MTTTSFLQKYPDYYLTFKDCDNYNKNYNKEQSNNRYKNFTQIHFTAGDEDQFNMYRFDKKLKEDENTKEYSLNENIYENTKLFETWEKYKNLDGLSTTNTFRYIFYKFKKGIFIKILNNELKVFLPFSNVNFINEWYKNIKIDPQYENIYSFFENICNMEGRSFNKKYINTNIDSWYGNNCLLRYEFPINEGDTNVSSIHDMLLELCKNRKIPDIEFFINRRDFPIITRDGFEAYYDLWNDMEKSLVSHNYENYTPILSMSSFQHFADILMPSYDDWNRSQSPQKWFPKSSQNYDYVFDILWKDKIPTAVFRGSSTGSGLTIETNQRLKVSYMSKVEKFEKNNNDYLNAGITKWNIRPKKYINNKYLETLNLEELDLELVEKLTPYEQSKYKYIIHIDGHVTAHRLSYELSMNSVILLVKNKWKNWYYDLLNPYTHYIPVKEDLSDLIEKIEWCRNNDDKCQIITENAKKFYDKYLSVNGILDYWQKLLLDLKKDIGNFNYNTVKPFEVQIINQYKFLFPNKKDEELKNIFNYKDNIQKILFFSEYINIHENEKVKKYINNLNDINLVLDRNFSNIKTIETIFHTLIKNRKFLKMINFEKNIFKNKSSLIELYSLNNYKFIIKSTNNNEKFNEYIHESFIGINCINTFLQEIPNFCYNFGILEDNKKYKIIYEYIEGQTLQEYIKSKEFNFFDFLEIILQICLAINFAQEKCCFVHYDLSIWNIIIKKLNYYTEVDYIINNKIVSFKTKLIPVIIDYGRSHVSYKNIHYGLINMYSYSKILNKSNFSILLKIVKFITKTKYCPYTFKNSKDIKKFFYNAKKYSNIVNSNKYELDNKSPIDLFYHIVNNINYKYNFKYKEKYIPYMTSGGYVNHSIEKLFSHNGNLELLSYENQINFLLKENFNILNVHEIYLEIIKFETFVKNFMFLCNDNNIDIKKYQKTLYKIENNINNIFNIKCNFYLQKNIDICKICIDTNYDENIFLFPEKIKYKLTLNNNLEKLLQLFNNLYNIKKSILYKNIQKFNNYIKNNDLLNDITNIKTLQIFERIIL